MIWQKVSYIFDQDTFCAEYLTHQKTDWLILHIAMLNLLMSFQIDWFIIPKGPIWPIILILPDNMLNLYFSWCSLNDHEKVIKVKLLIDSFVIKLWSCAEFASCSSMWILSSLYLMKGKIILFRQLYRQFWSSVGKPSTSMLMWSLTDFWVGRQRCRDCWWNCMINS